MHRIFNTNLHVHGPSAYTAPLRSFDILALYKLAYYYYSSSFDDKSSLIDDR